MRDFVRRHVEGIIDVVFLAGIDTCDEADRFRIIKSLQEAVYEAGIYLDNPIGEIIEDRGTQITFSGRGQDAPASIKQDWDKDHSKREKIISFLKPKIPEFEVRIGGMTSIDIDKKGLDKAYAVKKIKEITKTEDEDIIFIGDALYREGNDEPIKKTEVDFIQAADPKETLHLLEEYL